MLIHKNTNLRQGILGVTSFQRRERQYAYRLTQTVSCLPACLDALDITKLDKLHSQTNSTHKGFRNTKMSSEIIEKLGSDVVIKENLQDLPLSSTYETAMEALSSLITGQKRGNRTVVGAKTGKLNRMLMYIKIFGLEEQMAGLNIIHVAGTKGKGSTCTFCEAILRECGFRTGLFTSPHLIDVRERFRLNGLDISEDKFLMYFWDCWNQLKESVTEDLPMPPLFQFLTVLAFKIFISEKVDVAVIEVGLGGSRDSTNVIEKPVVCGITSLGLDHVETLGDTIGKIASHKAGIFKPQVPAFTVPQLSEAMDVLHEKAREKMVPLEEVAPLDPKMLGGLKLSLSGDHQFINAGLAVSLCKKWLQSTGNWEKLFQNDSLEYNLPEAFLRGLSTAHLSGRAQIVHDPFLKSHSPSEVMENSSGDLIFYLDGAHSPESMEVCGRWFSNAVKVNRNLSSQSSSFKVGNAEELWENGYAHHEKEKETDKISKRILLFNCMEVRDPQILLPQLVSTCASSGTHFSKAIFIPSMSTYNKVTSGATVIPFDIPAKDLSWQFNLQRVWEKIIHGKDVVVDKSPKMEGPQTLPPHEFLYKDPSHCNPVDKYFACSAVIPSLPLTINWLRDCVRENPSLRIQVLVTGSMHLVGDVLKLLRK
ncbi:folylpolyglutamate synthase isoform X1 [Camellia sinensis]|uniref:folylpolyglutamate synthase isoform X1 n=2 Tax=Camellia sinensis TaxID=4442 RepID=UPI001035E926|nr:folylpolyglutamate synthase isoform X1 [Camellia sinensis]XP_028069163.1 folylpolyglutamate synthase isoform X1 [Camellia sinensis]XP_028069164.1 folylpolyglutamate synthase isoform X1 [Camellia sinensis]